MYAVLYKTQESNIKLILTSSNFQRRVEATATKSTKLKGFQ